MSTTKRTLGVLALAILVGVGVYVNRGGPTDPASQAPRQRNETETPKSEKRPSGAVPGATASGIAVAGPSPASVANALPADAALEQKKQAVMGNVRRLARAWEQYRLQNGRAPESVVDLVGPGKLIEELKSVDGEDYSRALLPGGNGMFLVTTPNGIQASYGPAAIESVSILPTGAVQLLEARRLITPEVNKARNAFRAAHGGKFPNNTEELLPFFENPKTAADYVELGEAEKVIFSSPGNGGKKP